LLEREKLRVREEILRKLDDPRAFARDELLQLMYSRSRLGRGEEETLAQLDAITIDQLRRFHGDHYRPANTTISVVGDVDPDAVLAQIQAAFGGVERGELRLRRGPDESAPTALRYKAVQGDYDPNLVMVGFPLPGGAHRDLPALQVLDAILVGGQASRMRLPLERRDDLVFGLDSRLVSFEQAGLLEFTIEAADKREDQALRTLFVELERIRRFGAEEDELVAARRLLANRSRQRLQDVLSQARQLAGNPEASFQVLAPDSRTWAGVGSEDLQRVVTRWLDIPRASVVELLDRTLMQGRPFYSRMDAEMMQGHLEGAVLAASPSMGPFILPPPPPSNHSRLELAGWATAFDSPQAGAQGRLQRIEFENGTTLLVQEDASLPSTYVSLWFRGGRVAEVANSAGSTALIQKLMKRRTLNRTSESLGRELDGLGTRIDTLRELDGFGFGAEVYRSELPYLVDILYEIVAFPRFGALELERAKQRQYREIKAADRQLYPRSAQVLRQAAWGSHGYALPDLGDANSVSFALLDRLEELQLESCDPSNAVITVVGAVDAELLAEFLQPYMDDWSDVSDLFPAGAEEFFASEFIDPLPSFEDGAEAEVHRNAPLAASQTGFATPGPRDPAYPGVEVLSAWLGDAGDAIWNAQSPDARPLRLAVDLQGGALGSLLSVYLVADAGELDPADASLLQSVRGMSASPPSSDAASSAARERALDLLVQNQRFADRARELANREIMGLPPQTIEAQAQALQGVDAADLGTLLQSILHDGPHAVGRVQGAVDDTP
jgi:zinc protease